MCCLYHILFLKLPNSVPLLANDFISLVIKTTEALGSHLSTIKFRSTNIYLHLPYSLLK